MRVKAYVKLENGTSISGEFNTEVSFQRGVNLSDSDMVEYLKAYYREVIGDLYFNLLSDEEGKDSEISIFELEKMETE